MSAVATMFSYFTFCGEVTFPYSLNLFKPNQAKSKSREKRISKHQDGLPYTFQHPNTLARILPNIYGRNSYVFGK